MPFDTDPMPTPLMQAVGRYTAYLDRFSEEAHHAELEMMAPNVHLVAEIVSYLSDEERVENDRLAGIISYLETYVADMPAEAEAAE